MKFINPFDLLELDTTDSEAIKKAKRRKLADIELNDGFLELVEQKISKSEFIKLVDELDDNKRKMMYFFVKRNTHLSLFLSKNDVKFFYLYQSHKAYQNQDFINFISPYFAESFNKILLRAFKSGNSAAVNKLFSIPLLVNHQDTDKMYKNLTRLLNDKTEELQEIKNFCDEDVDDIIDAIKFIISVDLLNSLPSYFQSNRNDIAMELRHISVNIWNEFNDFQISCDIIYYALKIEIDGITKIKIHDALKQIKEIEERQKQEEKDKIIIQKWGDILAEIKSLIDDIENGKTDIRLVASD